MAALPVIKAPVVKLTDPKFEPTMEPYLNSTDPVSDSPASDPVTVPPEFEMSMLLLAHVIAGNARPNSTSKSTRLMTTLLNPVIHPLTASASGDRDLPRKHTKPLSYLSKQLTCQR
jgi:hypothetical protein